VCVCVCVCGITPDNDEYMAFLDWKQTVFIGIKIDLIDAVSFLKCMFTKTLTLFYYFLVVCF